MSCWLLGAKRKNRCRVQTTQIAYCSRLIRMRRRNDETSGRSRETRRNDSLDTSFDNDACNRVEMERHRIIILLSRYNRSSILISRMCIVTNDVYFQVLSNYIIINACISVCFFYFFLVTVEELCTRIIFFCYLVLAPRSTIDEDLAETGFWNARH